MYLTKVFAFLLLSTAIQCAENDTNIKNMTTPKDMYVVRATVYQVGILTNHTNETAQGNLGHQEAITFYHNNGTGIDFNSIPDPLLTNITAEKVVGLAPASKSSTPWVALKQLVSIPNLKDNSSKSMELNLKKSKRETSDPPDNLRPIEITKEAAVIPSEAGLQSIAIPPLLTFNKNLSKIPIPIPNTSVISYAKVNTLVHSP